MDMQVTFVEERPPASARQVAAVEDALGVTLPEDFKEFLRERNGGRPEQNVCDLPGGADIGVTEFFSVGLSGEGELVAEERRYRARVPRGLLPIADAEGGNLVCLSLRLDSYGQVVFWDHEGEAEEDEPPAVKNLSPIADSFAVFMRALRPFRPSVSSTSHEAWIDPALLAELDNEN